MRKNSPRKWLHACLDLLPVILIPVFMIYSHRHDVSSTSTYTEEVPVYYETNEVSSVNDLGVDKVYRYIDNFNETLPNTQYNFFEIYQTSNLNLDTTYDRITFQYYSGSLQLECRITGGNTTYVSLNNRPIDFVLKTLPISNTSLIIDYFTASETSIIKEYQTITYDFEKDIMGAFMNNFNLTIDNYFNMGNVFNLNGVYQWFNTNIFNGNAPQVIYSVWNIALYELVMDLLFLLYGLFMWFIDMVQHLMDKPFKSIK